MSVSNVEQTNMFYFAGIAHSELRLSASQFIVVLPFKHLPQLRVR